MSVSLLDRYTDAYAVAWMLVRRGDRYKTIGDVVKVFAGIVTAISVVALISGDENPFLTPGLRSLGGWTGLAFALLMAGIGTWCTARGLLISAQGQLLLAQLDVAVNTSTLLSTDDKRAVLGLDLASPGTEDASATQEPSAKDDVICQKCGADNPPWNQFCENCGARLAEVTT
jgi:ribosomal protein L40E